MSRRAVFLDRDGTLVHARHYPSRPDELVLFDGLAPELATLRADGYALVLITNQSGIARGLFPAAALDAMHEHLRTGLTAAGAALDAIYFCPHHPEGSVAEYAVDCDCRKPRPGMLRKAAGDLDLDLGRSWFVGDILDDVEAGNRAGCRTILVDLGTEARPATAVRTPSFVARDTVHALHIIRSADGFGTAADLTYLPESWQTIHGPAAALDRAGAGLAATVGGDTGGDYASR